MTNYEKIKNMDINELADFLTSMLDGENQHEVGCYDCMNYGTHHADISYKEYGLYECEGCPNEGIGLDIVRWLEKEV